MSLTPLTALSPVDGRYAARCADLREIFSHIKYKADALGFRHYIHGFSHITQQFIAIELCEIDRKGSCFHR